MRDYLVIINRGTPQPVQAPDSFTAWKDAIEANPDAQRVEVKAVAHSLILSREEQPPKFGGKLRDYMQQMERGQQMAADMLAETLRQHPDAKVYQDEIVITEGGAACGN
jgi:hypothetical protein